MAQRKRLLTDFAKKISALQQSEPKVFKKVFLKKSEAVQNIDNRNEKEKTTKQTEIIDTSQSSDENDSGEITSTQNNTSILFENSVLKAYIQKGFHKQEKRFALHDHLYFIKVEPKSNSFPLLMNILEFLEEACNYILNELKENYPLEHNQIGYLTVYQV